MQPPQILDPQRWIAAILILRLLPDANSAPIFSFNYNPFSLLSTLSKRRPVDSDYSYNPYDYDYHDYFYENPNRGPISSGSVNSATKVITRQFDTGSFFDLVASRVTETLGTLSVIGLTYLASSSSLSDLQMQVDSLRMSVTQLQSTVSTLSSSSSSSTSSVDSTVLASTCNTLKSITSLTGPVSTPTEIITYLRNLILVEDPNCG